jgi:hypothetical protein
VIGKADQYDRQSRSSTGRGFRLFPGALQTPRSGHDYARIGRLYADDGVGLSKPRHGEPEKDAAMKNFYRKFFRREDGAITVDWVVLAAAVIGMGMVVLVPIAFSTESSTQGVADYIGELPVGYGN